MIAKTFGRYTAPGAVVALSALFTFLVCGHGVPTLRHDWSWPINGESADAAFTSQTSGWDQRGFGVANPQIAGYVFAVPLWAVNRIAGTEIGLVIFVAAIALVAGFGALRIARMYTARTSAVALVPIALYNPWMYSKATAGHLYMCLCFGLALWLVAEFAARRIRQQVIALAMIAALAQLQFFVVLLVYCFAACAIRRAPLTWLAPVALAALPVATGIAGSSGFLSGVPYLLSWQAVQSVAPGDAAFLLGYFAQYTTHGETLFRAAGVVLAVTAAFACVRFLKVAPRRVVTLALLGIAFFLAVTGVRGPLGGAYSYLVLNVRASGLFRELYDLVAGLALVYVCLAAMLLRTGRLGAAVTACTGALYIAAWALYPPYNWFVPAARVPITAIHLPYGARFAVAPYLQPLSLDGEGSGADPDIFVRANDVAPLNSYAVRYPVLAAMGRAVKGDPSWLAMLGVAENIYRPSFTSNTLAIERQMTVPKLNPRIPPAVIRTFTPQLTVSDQPLTFATTPQPPDSNAVFFGDAPDRLRRDLSLPIFQAFHSDRRSADAAESWVDVGRIAFAEPELSSGIGGVVTRSRQTLRIDGGWYLLARVVRGRLLTARGAALLGPTDTFTWVKTDPAAAFVICNGLCAVYGESPVRPKIRHAAQARAIPVDDTRPLPWLVIGRELPHSAVLRFNETYDENWNAFCGRRLLPHFRAAAAANLYVTGNAGCRPVIVHVTAAVQAIEEVFGIAAFAIVASFAAFREKRTP